ncbi:MAG TPA: hypothetical protein VFN26_06675 [Candidatus Acidoferrum sp.]|nr:hypothetical protein [Candidatus Acidoferrum sp.]
MSTTPSTAHSQPASGESKGRSTFRGSLIEVLLIRVSLVPNLLHLRRSARSWLLFRIFLGIAGAALVIAPLGLSNGYIFSVAGLAMFASAILLPPAKPQTSVNEKAHELGAILVVNGGRFRPMDASSSVAVHFFVSAERVSVLDADLQPLLEIPGGEITSVRAVQTERGWLLRVSWANNAVEFSYRGIFAEHLTRVAESAIRSVMRHSLPVIPQTRAASA